MKEQHIYLFVCSFQLFFKLCVTTESLLDPLMSNPYHTANICTVYSQAQGQFLKFVF